MSLYNDPPRVVSFDGRNYQLKAPFDTVLFCYSVLERCDMLGAHKIRLCTDLLVGPVLMTTAKREQLLREIFRVLNGGDEKPSSSPRVMDFEQDAAFIRAAFLQQYGMDLDRERGRLSWFRFCDLLGGLTDDTAFMRIVEIRSAPIPAITKQNHEQVKKLIEQKAKFRLVNQNNTNNYQNQLRKLFEQMKEQAKAGDK